MNEYEDRQYWQKMNLAETLEYKSNCECCQCMIQNHSIVELQTCLQELSKRQKQDSVM
jgi:hypothetical protein